MCLHSFSFFLLQSVASDPFTSSFGGMGFSDDPFKSKSDTPALPPKKNVPPRPKPPSGKEVLFLITSSPSILLYVLGNKDKLSVFCLSILHFSCGRRYEIISRLAGIVNKPEWNCLEIQSPSLELIFLKSWFLKTFRYQWNCFKNWSHFRAVSFRSTFNSSRIVQLILAVNV